MRTLLFLSIFLTGFWASAQQAQITGQVKNEKDLPVPYVQVTVVETGQQTATDEKGNFSFESVPAKTLDLRFTAMGFASKTETVTPTSGTETNITVVLKEEFQDLGEIVITSNRRTETLDEVPSSVSVLTSEQIQTLSQTSNSVADILNEVPGLAMSTGMTSNTGQTLRGRDMLVLIDGIPQSTPLRDGSRDINTIDPNTIERIEVIKGATAIYGNGADGGIINYITKEPKIGKPFNSTTELSTEGSLVDIDHTVGSKVYQSFSGYGEKLGYVVSGSFRQTGIFRDANGEVQSPTYGQGETNQYSAFGKLNYQLNSSNAVEFMYNYFSSNQDTEYINQNGVYGERPAIGVIGEVLGVDQGNRYNHNGQLTYDSYGIFGNTDLKLNLYFQDFKTVYGYSPFFYNAEEGYEGGQSMITSSKKGVRANFKTGYELGQLNGDILYGIDILNDVTAQGLVDGRSWVPETDMTNFAPYAQLKTLYNDFVLKAGIRFENINIDIPDYTTIYIFPYGGDTPNGGVDVDGGTLIYDATTFNVGLRYNQWEAFKPFVSFSQSFSIADLGRTLRSATENTVSQISSEAVIANNYEAGFNSRLGNTRLSGAAFISTSELGATYKEVNGVFQIARQPEKVYGFEAAFDTRFTSNWSAGSSISWTEGELDSQDNGNYDTWMNGDRIPPLKTVTYLQYAFLNRFSARLSHTYSGNREKFDPKADGSYTYGMGPVNDFHLVNLSSSYQLTEETRIGLGVENLLNEDYYLPISQWDARAANYRKGTGARFNLSLQIEL
ncbi:iron complex outermembrane recepter protein [Salinimicrobium catena]|uniref:Iron complex outermembrane recepter protein n=1 Tax=Salinimicrobium catena TaxID=390640 RepID=A0A1H5NYB2_9FLAO|nr:TonB-dependent receptor [Salinimicrobium catena]SDL64828.1 iron complex outermembrane recepter protein [Salinimicrobium catena]SEF06673.1 iron complex outermembrane recepter protein [Salinimicrobium catena]